MSLFDNIAKRAEAYFWANEKYQEPNGEMTFTKVTSAVSFTLEREITTLENARSLILELMERVKQVEIDEYLGHGDERTWPEIAIKLARPALVARLLSKRKIETEDERRWELQDELDETDSIGNS